MSGTNFSIYTRWYPMDSAYKATGDADLDADPDPDPIFYFDADPDADLDPSFQIKAQNLGKVFK
jgi:hypothetical protein